MRVSNQEINVLWRVFLLVLFPLFYPINILYGNAIRNFKIKPIKAFTKYPPIGYRIAAAIAVAAVTVVAVVTATVTINVAFTMVSN